MDPLSIGIGVALLLALKKGPQQAAPPPDAGQRKGAAGGGGGGGGDQTGADVAKGISTGVSVAGSIAAGVVGVLHAVGGGAAATGGGAAVTAGTATAAEGTAATGAASEAAGAGGAGAVVAEGGAGAAGGLTLGAAAAIYVAIVAVLVVCTTIGLFFEERRVQWHELTAGGKPGAVRRAVANIFMCEQALFETFCTKFSPYPEGVPNFTRDTISTFDGVSLGQTYVVTSPTLPPLVLPAVGRRAAQSLALGPRLLCLARAWAVEHARAYELAKSNFYAWKGGLTLDAIEQAGIGISDSFDGMLDGYCQEPNCNGLPAGMPQTWAGCLSLAQGVLTSFGLTYDGFVEGAIVDGAFRGMARCAINGDFVLTWPGDEVFTHNIMQGCGFPGVRMRNVHAGGTTCWVIHHDGTSQGIDVIASRGTGHPVVYLNSQMVDVGNEAALAAGVL